MFLKYLCEFLGTMMLILLGDGVVANVTLNKSGMKGAGSIQITIAWGLAVMVPAFIFGKASGASFNPALTIALAAGGMFDWALVPGYVIAQILGGIVGGVLVYILFKDHFDATEDPGTKLGVFSTGPAIRNYGWNLVTEIIATFVLVFVVIGFGRVGDSELGSPAGLAALGAVPVALLVVGIGASLGGPTGYAINPARDLGPRIAHAVLPIAGKGGNDWGYSWIPVVGPIIGGIIAALVAVSVGI